jgi:hypothetical protein
MSNGFYGSGIYGAGIYGVGALGLSLTTQTVYPNRVLVAVTGLTVGQIMTVARYPAGSTTSTAVRGLSDVEATTDAYIKADAEGPFGVLLTYVLVVDDLDSVSATTTLSLDRVALTDAISGDGVEVVIMAWPDKRTERAASVYPVGGRNIVVSGQAGGFSAGIDLFVETDTSKNNVLTLLRNATSGIIQIRSDQSITSDGVDCYVVPTAWTETRYSQDGTDERRVITLDAVESTPWGPSLESSTFDLQDIADAYPGLTMLDIAADYPGTLLDIALGDYS